MSTTAARPAGSPLRVLFLTIDIRIGGAERLVLELARQLDRERFEPSVGWFADEPPPREFVELGIPLYPLRKQPGFDRGAMRRIADIVRERRIDVINAHHFMSFVYAWYAAKLANRAGLVYTEHSESDVLSATGRWRWAGTALLRAADGVIGVSPGVSSALARHFRVDAGRLHTIENGVDVLAFGAHGERDRVRDELGIDRDAFVIGHVANFRHNKNHLFLLKAFLQAFGRHGSARLILIGQGSPKDPENSLPAVTAFVRDNGLEASVALLGYRPDVARLLQAMDVFCLVSHKEGLPLSVIEAMASGLPVVATDIDGLREVVEPGVNGALVAPDDVDGLAGVLSRLVEEPAVRRCLGQAARRIAGDRYSFTRCLAETQQVLADARGVPRR